MNTTASGGQVAIRGFIVQTLVWAGVEKFLLAIGLAHLTLGRIALYRTVLAQADAAPCQIHLTQALTHLRRANDL